MMKFIPGVIISLAFLVVSIFTLSDYGINWDEPYHFMRGQAYLNYYLFGKKDYSNLPNYPRLNSDCPEWAADKCGVSGGGADDVLYSKDGKMSVYEDVVTSIYKKEKTSLWRSVFQHDSYTFDEIIKGDGGHPAANDILAAFFNFIFYQKLHFLGDIESYHLLEVFVSSLIVFGVFAITYLEFGIIPGIVASLSLATYPLFFSESHFNIKDPLVASFVGLTVILFYLGIRKLKPMFIILSSFFAALSLGTKFNVLFIFPVIVLWLVFYTLQNIKWKPSRPLTISLLLFPLIVAGLFYLLWPYLWIDSVRNILMVINYYRQIGLGTPSELTNYLIYGWNTFPIVWIFYTTPVPVLIFSLIGLTTSIYLLIFKKNSFVFLILLWFLVPILRVSLPGTDIYGGIRQISEFMPAMAILSGVGVWLLISKPVSLSKKVSPKLIAVVALLSFAFVISELIKIHPNENVYFNQFAGGLSGAKSKNVPYWGNSYGNAYLQGVNWLNANAEPNTKLAMPIVTMANLPRLKLRSDIDYWSGNISGYKMKGEYVMEMSHNWQPDNWYSYAFYNYYFNPVYEVKVDGVAILKIWKNDSKYLKSEIVREEKINNFKSSISGNTLTIDLKREISLTKVKIVHDSFGCNTQSGGYIRLSVDKKNWKQENGSLDVPQMPVWVTGVDERNFVFLFLPKKARYIFLDTEMNNSCVLKNPSIEIFGEV